MGQKLDTVWVFCYKDLYNLYC